VVEMSEDIFKQTENDNLIALWSTIYGTSMYGLRFIAIQGSDLLLNKKIHIRAYRHMNIKQSFEMTKREKIACLVILGILIAYGFYQAVYATNESDYRWGFKSGEEIYQQCSRYTTCTVEENLVSAVDCQLPYHGPHWYRNGHMLVQIGPSHSVDNVTACNDGYFHGWINECKNDGGGPICKYQDGGPIIAATTGPGHCYNTTKEGETCESGNFIPIH
jgi:hypothetical protein